MVFESIINPLTAEKHPYEMFFVGILYSCIAMTASLILFANYASLISIFLIVLMSSKVMFELIKTEEKKDFNYSNERTLLKEHSKALSAFIFLFLGIAISLSFWYMFLPSEQASQAFELQELTISDITGNAINPGMILGEIFISNLKILVICIAFAFVFGFGAIFILTWNASVLGVVIGNFAKSSVSGNLVTGYSLGLLRYLTHGIPEMLAFFTAGLGAGILSVAIIRHDYTSKKFRHVISDSAGLLVLSIVMLFMAALIEVFITPLFF